ncbi:MAG: N-6 DNA methylase [Alphaproteobacteria bacterium]|nr:N-6 DNA methylase [Alphaproteobacteria bacterium]
MVSKDMDSLYQTYLSALAQTPLVDKTEATNRTDLENLLNALIPNDIKSVIKIIQEASRADSEHAEFGTPDFTLKKGGLIVGYIENKKIDEDLSKIVTSQQIKKYQNLSDNILITNYCDWILLGKDGDIKKVNLFSSQQIYQKNFTIADDNIEALQDLLKQFFSNAPEKIARVNMLAKELAMRGNYLREFLNEELINQQNHRQHGRLYGLYVEFKTQISQSLTITEFADAFAQTLAYGLFMAKLQAGENQEINLSNAKNYIANNFSLIQEMVSFLDELNKPEYLKTKWIIDEILAMMNRLNLAAITLELADTKKRTITKTDKEEDIEAKEFFARDPYIYFYEDFLKAWDSETRKARGVYYTPPPAVNFIIRAVDDVLQKDFNIQQGLADKNAVNLLDFATGTGTFLLEVFRQILEKTDTGSKNGIISEHILKNFYGFEYLIAPYTVAHLKLSQYLASQNYQMADNERLQIYLTNTLEDFRAQRNLLLPALSDESELASNTKKQPILIITGNPPYNINSKNNGQWITDLIETYKYVDGQPLNESNPKALQDDYVKFIRFAQYKMHDLERGMIAVITSHGFLDNLTFRGMRQSLMNDFDRIYLLDLHGNRRQLEIAPDGSEDKNIFLIEQGVAISIFIKDKTLTEKGVFYKDFYGTRDNKYRQLLAGNLQNIEWQKLQPQTPFYMFIPRNNDNFPTYQNYWSVKNIFPISSSGIKTHRDHFAFTFTEEKIQEHINDMVSDINDGKLRLKYNLIDNDDWQLSESRKLLKDNVDYSNRLQPCLYNPFDTRYCYYGIETMDRPRGEIMQHMLAGDNVGLLSGRAGSATGSKFYDIFHITDTISDVNIFRRGGGCLFPLYLYPPAEGEKNSKAIIDNFGNNPFADNERIENIAPAFREFIDKHYGKIYSPEQILGYIYAILHSEKYRTKYLQFLKSDFPRIPFTPDAKKFMQLAKIGQSLIDTHLLKTIPQSINSEYAVAGDNIVITPRHNEVEARLYINKTQYFSNISAEIYAFHIGGYQVLDKYLKSRKGRTLNLDEINNIKNTAEALAFTIKQMQKIDGVDFIV